MTNFVFFVLFYYDTWVARKCIISLIGLISDERQIYIEDIYSFAVNTINIAIECNENVSIFTSAKHE